MGQMKSVYISIGSNMGNRLGFLEMAVNALEMVAEVGVVCSAIYETRPVGFDQQPDFLNMVVRIRVSLSPNELLKYIQAVEIQAGRTRDIRYGPRTLDLDILLYEDEYVCFRHLQIPHPRMWERSFVLVPLAELTSDRRGLGGKSIRELAKAIIREGDIQYVGHFW
jgi:2-amino-4-hydroxy-6-hydroxymethyldihydropteridine diphosphokinase